MINLNKDAIPCTQFLGERLNDYFNAQISSQAYQQALATHYSSPSNQALEGEYLNIKVQPEVFTQSTSYTDITLVKTASQGVEFLMGLTNPTDINILKRNLILKHFFRQQEQLLNTDNSVNFAFIDNLKAKLHSSLYNNQTINEDQRLEVRCLLAGLNYNQRSSLIDYCFTKMNGPTATGTNRAPYAEIVLGALEIAPPSQYSQLRTLISANGYSYYNQLANLVTPNKLYENSTAAFATWVVNGFTSQKARAIRIIDRYARDKNQAIENSFDPALSPSVNGVQFVPLIPMSILHGMSDPMVTSSYSAGSNTYTFYIDLGTEITVSAAPFDLIQVEVMENFNNSYVVRPDNGEPLKQGDKFLIPASTLHNIIQQNELAVYNVSLTYLLEAAFIAGTGGTGLGILALEVTVMGTQLVIEDNMGDIQYMPEGPTKNMILGFRDYANYFVVGAGLSQMMLNGVQRSPFIIREQVGNDFKFTFKSNEKGMALSRLDEAGELSANISKIRGILNSMDNVTDVGLVSVKKHLEAFEMDSRFLQIAQNTGAHKVHFSPISKRAKFHYITDEYNPTQFTPKRLFDVQFIANDTKARLTNIQWLSASYSGDIVLVSRMKNMNYQPPGETQFVDGRVEVVKTNSGQLYVRIPPFDVLKRKLENEFTSGAHSNLLAWLDEIPDTKISLLQKLDDLPSSSYASLDGDIGNVSALKTEFQSNEKLLDVWEELEAYATLRENIQYLQTVNNFQINNPTRIDRFRTILNDSELYPDELMKAELLESVGVFSGINSINTTSNLHDVLSNVRETHIVRDLRSKGINKLFRGTNLDVNGMPYVGNSNTLEFGASSSTDPIVATIFGIQAKTEHGGTGVLIIANTQSLDDIDLIPPNYRVELEREVILDLTPSNFYTMKELEISVEQARTLILQITGYDVGTNITNITSTQILNDSPRMTVQQIQQFYQMATSL